MTLAICYRITCDHKGCDAVEVSPHNRTRKVRDQLVAMGWTILGHRIPRQGVKRFWRRGDTEVDDVGGGPRRLYLCPKHGDWRPRRGIVKVIAQPTAQAIRAHFRKTLGLQP